VRVGGRQVEVQVRTDLQDAWANFFERLADSWGRQIRYGEAPTDPDVVTPFADGQPTTRSKVVQEALDLSNLIDDLERSPSLRKVPSLLWAHRTARRQHRREEELDQAVAAMKDEILENLRQQQVG
jgi:hypothetical protein